MKMIFLFKAYSPEDESFERDYELPYDATLLDFHNLIVEDLGFDENEMASFFTSDKTWAKIQEFTSEKMFYGENDTDLDELTPTAMEDVLLGQVIKEKHARLLYVFDLLSNRGLLIELIKSYKSEDEGVLPCVLMSKGEAPLQINDDMVAEDVSDMFDDYEDDLYSDDEYNDFTDGFDEYSESETYY